MMEQIQKNNKTANLVIGILSVAIPLVVAILIFMPQTGKLGDFDVSFLPHLNGILNSATAICLIAGFIAVKNKKNEWHKTFMMSAFVLSSIFLISYVIFHFQGTPTLYGDANHDQVLSAAEKEAVSGMRLFYVIILLTHIILSAVVVPLVLFSIYFAMTKQIKKHKKLVKYTFPIWLYVAITGVLVYLLIRSYYTF